MNPHFFNKMLFGFGLIAAGVLFLLHQLGVVPFSFGSLVSTYWPVIIIYVGLSGFIYSSRFRRHPGAYIWNIALMIAGTVLLLNRLGVTNLSFHDVFQYALPFVLITFGVGMLFRPARRPQEKDDDDRRQRKEERRRWKEMKDACKHNRQDFKETHSSSEPYSAHDYIHTDWSGNVQQRSSFIGDVHLGQEYWELTPLNISHFVGDTVIDLTKASIPSGETKIIVSAFIGDVKLFVPTDYDVEVRVEAASFIGDMNVLDRKESGMMRSITTQTPHYADAGKKIRLVVSMFIGDVVVKRVG